MTKIVIFYDSKYGNTKLVSENIAEGLRRENIEVELSYVKNVDLKKLIAFDAIVLGAPNHMGRPSWAMKKFIDRLAELNLKEKKIAVFGTYSGRLREKDRAVKKVEQSISKKLPSFKLVLPGISVRVNGVSGPVANSELPRCVEFGKTLANAV